MTRATLVVSALAVALALGLGAAGALRRLAGRDVIAADEGGAVFSDDDARVGQSYEIGLAGFDNTSDHVVRFVKVEPLDVSPGLVIEAVRAVDNCTDVKATIGIGIGRAEQVYPNLGLHPVDAAIIAPRSYSCWYFLIAVRPTATGTQRIGSFRLTYRVAGRTEHHHVDYTIELHVTGPGPDPRVNSPAPLDVIPPATPPPTRSS